MKKKFLCLGLAIIISAAQVVPALADREADLRQEKAATSSQLESTNNKIWGLEQKTNELQEEINQADAQLVDVLVAIDVLKDEIGTKKGEIAQTKEDLKAAEADQDKQYDGMKRRIQYIYENGGDAAWAQMLLESEDISTLLNKAEYTQSLYDYDRDKLEAYIAVVQQVADLGNKLESEKADLEVMKMDHEEQQNVLETVLSEKKAASSDYKNQIANAEEQAQAYKSLLEQQSAEIQQIQAEKQAAAEAAARKKAEEAARKEAARKEAEKASKATVRANENNNEDEAEDEGSSTPAASKNEANNNDNSNNDNSNNDNSNNDTTPAVDNYDDDEDEAEETNTGGGGSSNSSENESSGVAYSGSGQAAVNYATQFVGNPYVWGGTSLTGGADCSGFIMSVYANFGVSLPHSSAGMRSSGVSVPYSQAMPGDIICYSGHVAIYMGGGSIVHASNERDGIKISGNAAYRTILSVRRVI